MPDDLENLNTVPEEEKNTEPAAELSDTEKKKKIKELQAEIKKIHKEAQDDKTKMQKESMDDTRETDANIKAMEQEIQETFHAEDTAMTPGAPEKTEDIGRIKKGSVFKIEKDGKQSVYTVTNIEYDKKGKSRGDTVTYAVETDGTNETKTENLYKLRDFLRGGGAVGEKTNGKKEKVTKKTGFDAFVEEKTLKLGRLMTTLDAVRALPDDEDKEEKVTDLENQIREIQTLVASNAKKPGEVATVKKWIEKMLTLVTTQMEEGKLAGMAPDAGLEARMDFFKRFADSYKEPPKPSAAIEFARKAPHAPTPEELQLAEDAKIEIGRIWRITDPKTGDVFEYEALGKDEGETEEDDEEGSAHARKKKKGRALKVAHWKIRVTEPYGGRNPYEESIEAEKFHDMIKEVLSRKEARLVQTNPLHESSTDEETRARLQEQVDRETREKDQHAKFLQTRFEWLGLGKEDIKKIPNFESLSREEQIVALDLIQQDILGMMYRHAGKESEAATPKAKGFLGKVFESARYIVAGDQKPVKEVQEGLRHYTHEMGNKDNPTFKEGQLFRFGYIVDETKQVRANEYTITTGKGSGNEGAFSYAISFAEMPDGASENLKNVTATFNAQATRFSKMPYAWSTTATGKASLESVKYYGQKKMYESAKEGLEVMLEIARDHGEPAPRVDFDAIDNEIIRLQKLHHVEDATTELFKLNQDTGSHH